MNLSLRNRVASSFIIANLAVLLLSFIVFHFLNSLNKDIENITVKSNRISLLTDDIRISAVSLLKYQRRILINKPDQKLVEKVVSLCDSFTSQLHHLDSLYKDPEVKKIVAQMLSYVDSLKLILSKAALYSDRDNIGMRSVAELADKILDAFSEFQDIQYFQSVERDKKIKKIINETKRTMMIVLIIGFLGTIILALVVPGKIALPFKKIKDAIRELQDCNFDVSIYYSGDDEIGEIAREMNKMIHSIKIFDELRTDRIGVENRKFDALANLVRRPVLVANADSKLIYMNNQLYSLLQVQSEDVIGKDMTGGVIPESIIGAYELAIKRRSKIENFEVLIPRKKAISHEDIEGGLQAKAQQEEAEAISAAESSATGTSSPAPDLGEDFIFKGFANVIPIRGKDSSLDYYIMVMSKDTFS